MELRLLTQRMHSTLLIIRNLGCNVVFMSLVGDAETSTMYTCVRRGAINESFVRVVPQRDATFPAWLRACGARLNLTSGPLAGFPHTITISLNTVIEYRRWITLVSRPSLPGWGCSWCALMSVSLTGRWFSRRQRKGWIFKLSSLWRTGDEEIDKEI